MISTAANIKTKLLCNLTAARAFNLLTTPVDNDPALERPDLIEYFRENVVNPYVEFLDVLINHLMGIDEESFWMERKFDALYEIPLAEYAPVRRESFDGLTQGNRLLTQGLSEIRDANSTYEAMHRSASDQWYARTPR